MCHRRNSLIYMWTMLLQAYPSNHRYTLKRVVVKGAYYHLLPHWNFKDGKNDNWQDFIGKVSNWYQTIRFQKIKYAFCRWYFAFIRIVDLWIIHIYCTLKLGEGSLSKYGGNAHGTIYFIQCFWGCEIFNLQKLLNFRR